jgi:cardiolipin synthase
MTHLWLLALAANYVVAVLTAVAILRGRREPAAMLAWLFAVITLPVAGSAAYILFGSNRIPRKAGRRRRRVAHLLKRFERWAEQRVKPAGVTDVALPEDLAPVHTLALRLGQMPAVGGNRVQVFQEANATYAALEEAIGAARQHIHLLYYIWQPDQTGTHFRDLLVRKAREGVQCRMLLDAIGCARLTRRFTRPLIDAGVQVAFFLPLRPFRKRWTLHLRNHRKIAVIDGVSAFLGSQNIGDEYRGRLKRLSPWYDSHMRIDGPGASFLQQVFAEDWLFATREDIDRDACFPPPQSAGDSVVQILPTGPDQDISVLGQIIFAAVSSAHESILIATPYFVPDPGLLMALAHACYRGVRVRMVLPTRSDAPLVLWAGRSYYPELLDAGVELFEFDAGVLHSKIITVDDRWAMLGSANMDVRRVRGTELRSQPADHAARRLVAAAAGAGAGGGGAAVCTGLVGREGSVCHRRGGRTPSGVVHSRL